MCITGCRPKEILEISWREIDSDIFQLPKERTKTRVAREIRLTPYLMSIIERHKDKDDLYVFKGRRSKSAFTTRGLAQSLQKVIPHVSGYSGRKTCKTLLMATGCGYIVSEMTLGHAKADLDKAYDHHDYIHEVFKEQLKLSAIVEQLRINKAFQEYILEHSEPEIKRLLLTFNSEEKVLAFVKSLSSEKVVSFNEVQHG